MLSRLLRPAVVVNVMLGFIWSAGALVQAEMTREGLAYPHGYIYSAIMGLGGATGFAFAIWAISMNEK